MRDFSDGIGDGIRIFIASRVLAGKRHGDGIGDGMVTVSVFRYRHAFPQVDGYVFKR